MTFPVRIAGTNGTNLTCYWCRTDGTIISSALGGPQKILLVILKRYAKDEIPKHIQTYFRIIHRDHAAKDDNRGIYERVRKSTIQVYIARERHLLSTAQNFQIHEIRIFLHVPPKLPLRLRFPTIPLGILILDLMIPLKVFDRNLIPHVITN